MTHFLSRTKPHHAKMELFVIYIVDGGDDERGFPNSSNHEGFQSDVFSSRLYVGRKDLRISKATHSLLSLFSFLQTLVSSSVKCRF